MLDLPGGAKASAWPSRVALTLPAPMRCRPSTPAVTPSCSGRHRTAWCESARYRRRSAGCGRRAEIRGRSALGEAVIARGEIAQPRRWREGPARQDIVAIACRDLGADEPAAEARSRDLEAAGQQIVVDVARRAIAGVTAKQREVDKGGPKSFRP